MCLPLVDSSWCFKNNNFVTRLVSLRKEERFWLILHLRKVSGNTFQGEYSKFLQWSTSEMWPINHFENSGFVFVPHKAILWVLTFWLSFYFVHTSYQTYVYTDKLSKGTKIVILIKHISIQFDWNWFKQTLFPH